MALSGNTIGTLVKNAMLSAVSPFLGEPVLLNALRPINEYTVTSGAKQVYEITISDPGGAWSKSVQYDSDTTWQATIATGLADAVTSDPVLGALFDATTNGSNVVIVTDKNPGDGYDHAATSSRLSHAAAGDVTDTDVEDTAEQFWRRVFRAFVLEYDDQVALFACIHNESAQFIDKSTPVFMSTVSLLDDVYNTTEGGIVIEEPGRYHVFGKASFESVQEQPGVVQAWLGRSDDGGAFSTIPGSLCIISFSSGFATTASTFRLIEVDSNDLPCQLRLYADPGSGEATIPGNTALLEIEKWR